MIGEMRERIRFVRNSRTARDDGGYDVADATVATRWASVSPVQANEREAHGRMRGAVTYLIKCDPQALALTVDDRIVWLTNGNVELNIREIRTPGARAMTLDIVAEYQPQT